MIVQNKIHDLIDTAAQKLELLELAIAGLPAMGKANRHTANRLGMAAAEVSDVIEHAAKRIEEQRKRF